MPQSRAYRAIFRSFPMKWFSKKADPTPQSPIEELEDKEFTALYNTGEMRRVDPGGVLFREGDDGQTVYLVLKGAFRIATEGEPQEEQITAFKEGDWIGEMLFGT